MAFRNHDRVGLKSVQRELNQLLGEARRKHKDVIEQNFASMDSKKLWVSMKAATNMTTHRKCLITCDDLSKSNELNDFFLRFDTQDFSLECNNVLQSITTVEPCSRLVVDPLKIQFFSHVCKKKSAGPDGISAFLLKTFAAELTPAWCPVFQKSADSHLVPALWKKIYHYSHSKETLSYRKQ